MFRISTKSQYGLRAIVYLAKAKGKVSPLKAIAQKEKLSFDYLEKIMAKLVKADLVETKRGAGGGYYLAKAPSRIKMAEVIRALEGKGVLVKCLVEEKVKPCPFIKKCLAKNFWVKIQRSLNNVLNSVTLADLIKDGKN